MEGGVIVPQLYQTWEWIDPLRMRVTIREDLKFHDGTAVTMDDVLFSVGRQLEPTYGKVSLLSNLTHAEKVNDTTFDLVLSKADILIQVIDWLVPGANYYLS